MINYTKSRDSDEGNISEPRMMPLPREIARSCVNIDKRVSAIRGVQVLILFCLRKSCNNVTEFCETRVEYCHTK
jgi:hypothetical protein